VSREVKDQLIQRAADFHIVLEDIAITHLTFGKEFASAIEKKQVAQQEAERQVMSPNTRVFLGAWGKMPWV
jgi:regulator of protease activity HflC (stomatin/prohibitin superfamily)